MKKFRILWISLAIFILDQAAKIIVRSYMQLHESIQIIGNFFRLTFVENPGMAFGITMSNNMFFTIFAMIASIVILLYMFKMKSVVFLPRFAMATIFGGAIGNLFDRLLRGKVVDFLDFEFFDISISPFDFLFFHFPGYQMERWPVFNVADIAVTVGMIMLLIVITFEKEPAEDIEEIESEMIR